uniref:Uncharacterized protein n=1 Tax=viral metagenome TaxID=1070528 RepID=A0A6C0B0I9_9ZZZZ
MEWSTIFIIILIVILIIVFSSHIVVVNRNHYTPNPIPVPYPVPYPTPVTPVYKPMVGGCAGTQFGCCPNSSDPKVNAAGTNCYH